MGDITNNKLIRAQKKKDDEFYTIYRQFELWLQKYLMDKLKGKVVYCPCDTAESNIVKVLQDYRNQLEFKDLIYTSDDFRTHGDIFDACDVVITNPPFSLAKEWFGMLFDSGKEFFSYGAQSDIYKTYMRDHVAAGDVKALYCSCIGLEKITGDTVITAQGHERDHRVYDMFMRPDGTYFKVNHSIYTNIPGIEYPAPQFQLTRTFDDVRGEIGYLDGTRIINVGKDWRHYPKDYSGIGAISPVRYSSWQSHFDVVCVDRKVIDPILKQDGKNIFMRWLVRLKGSDAKLEDYLTA